MSVKINKNGQWELLSKSKDGKAYLDLIGKEEGKKSYLDMIKDEKIKKLGDESDMPSATAGAEPMEMDDKPHPEGSPEAKAHDVIEHGDDLHEEMKDLSPEERESMMQHLMSLKSKRDLRSPENQKAGK